MEVETVYRITGLPKTWDREQRKYVVLTNQRKVVLRAGAGHPAYYSSLGHAKNGLAGFKGQYSAYEDLRIESLTGEWYEVDA